MDNVKQLMSWRRYLSYQYIFSKIREKGFIWAIKTAIFRFLFMVALYALYLMRIRFLPILLERIGHIAVEPDCYIKEGKLGLRPPYIGIILADPKRVANAHLLRYWRRYLVVISHPLLLRLLTPFSTYSFLQYDIWRYTMVLHDTTDRTVSSRTIQRKWADKAPLLSLSDSDQKKGRGCLGELGLNKGHWFVCVHAREAGYSGYPPSERQEFRDVDIYSYIPAMRAIIERGGWCIRVGDSSMKKLPQMDHVIDYAHLPIRSDWMDVFLCANCKFFLGSTSGLSVVPSVFGVPCAIANMAPMAVSPNGLNDIYMPMLYWSIKEERYLTFKEIFDSPAANYLFTNQFVENGLRTVANFPEHIKNLAIEMLERIESKAGYTEEDQSLQDKFNRLVMPGHHSYGARFRVARDFLREYASLLPDDN